MSQISQADIGDLTVRHDGRVAVVTGGASGIGAAIAHLLGGQGARVAVLDQDLDAARDTAGSVGDGARAYAADVSDAESVRRAVAEVEGDLGVLDILVNCAGRGPAGPGRGARARRLGPDHAAST